MRELLPTERIVSKIYFIRNSKVMLDRDLAELYEVETGQLKRAVKRNFERFPPDFMFEMSKKELEDWRCQFGTSNADKMGLRYKTHGFYRAGSGHVVQRVAKQKGDPSQYSNNEGIYTA